MLLLPWNCYFAHNLLLYDLELQKIIHHQKFLYKLKQIRNNHLNIKLRIISFVMNAYFRIITLDWNLNWFSLFNYTLKQSANLKFLTCYFELQNVIFLPVLRFIIVIRINFLCICLSVKKPIIYYCWITLYWFSNDNK